MEPFCRQYRSGTSRRLVTQACHNEHFLVTSFKAPTIPTFICQRTSQRRGHTSRGEMSTMILRKPSCRNIPAVTILIAMNMALLMLLLRSRNVQDTTLWASNKLCSQSVSTVPSHGLAPPATVTITAVTTTTAIVETVQRPAPPPKAPGPGFCEACGPDDAMCTLYGCASNFASFVLKHLSMVTMICI